MTQAARSPTTVLLYAVLSWGAAGCHSSPPPPHNVAGHAPKPDAGHGAEDGQETSARLLTAQLGTIRVGSESGVDLAGVTPAYQGVTMDWFALHECYRAALGVRRYARARVDGQARYSVAFWRGAPSRVHVMYRDGLPDSLVACADDVVRHARYPSPDLQPAEFTLRFDYEEPHDVWDGG